MSKSATKARIGPERARRIVDIPRLCSRLIPARGAFVADLDKLPSRTVPGTTPAPPRPASHRGEPRPETATARHRRGGPVIHRMCTFRRFRVSFPPVSASGRAGAYAAGTRSEAILGRFKL